MSKRKAATLNDPIFDNAKRAGPSNVDEMVFDDPPLVPQEPEYGVPDSPDRSILDAPFPPRPRMRKRADRRQKIGNANVGPGNYCSYRFVSHNAHLASFGDRYLKLKGQAEKPYPIDKEKLMPTDLRAIHEREGLKRWFRLCGPSSSQVAREIYVNLRFGDEGESKDDRVVYCRNKWVILTPETIGAALRFTPLEPGTQCAYHDMIRRDDVVPMVNAFCFQGEGVDPWDKSKIDVTRWMVAKGTLAPRSRWVCELLENWVLGITPNPQFSFKLCCMAMCVWLGRRIDIPRMIWDNIMARKSDGNRMAPGHTCLLTRLAIEAGAVVDDLDLVQATDREWNKYVNPPKPSRAKKGKEKVGESSGSDELQQRMYALMLENKAVDERRFAHDRSSRRRLGASVRTVGKWMTQLAISSNVALDPDPETADWWYESSDYEEAVPDEDEEILGQGSEEEDDE